MAREETLAARWLRGPQPIIHHPVALAFHTLPGGIYPGDLRFRPAVVLVVEIWNDVRSADGNLSSPTAAGLRHQPERKLSRRLAPWAPADQPLLSSVEVSTP